MRGDIIELLEPRRLLARVLCVDVASPGPTRDGTSWATAYIDVQQALAAAASGDEIRVADGTYKPNTGTNRSATFQLKTGVAINGGYAGYGAPNPDARDIAANLTVLSGDSGVAGSKTDNNYHVVTGSGTTSTAVLDGFTIRDGNANGSSSPTNAGGGMYNSGGSPTLRNCTFTANSAGVSAASGGGGGAIRNTASSFPSIVNCSFTNNTSVNYGGAIQNDGASQPSISNSTFSGNLIVVGGTTSEGGAISNFSVSPVITGCTFGSNSALLGGAIYNSGSAPNISNCAFNANTADNGGGVYNESSSSPTITGCTFSANVSNYLGGGAIFTRYNGTISSPTVSGSTFSGNIANGSGGAMYTEAFSATTVTACTFSGNKANRGGAVYEDTGAKTKFTACTFTANAATSGGGAVYLKECNTRITNCVIADSISRDSGGAVYFSSWAASSYPILADCTIGGNWAAIAGGGIYTDAEGGSAAPARLVNSVLWGNVAPAGAGIYNFNGSTVGQTSWPIDVTYSDVQGGYAGSGNVSVDPLFLRNPAPGADGTWGTGDDDVGDLRLLAASPVVDAGSNAAVPAGVTTDRSGGPRFLDVPTTPDTGVGPAPVADMGAFETTAGLVASAGGGYAVISGQTLVLNGRGASDVAGPLQYAWEWTGNGLFDDASGASPAFPVASFPAGSSVNVSVRVTDTLNRAATATTIVRVVPPIAYVDARATAGGNTGLSWNDAYLSLSSALAQSIYGQAIRIATGTYRPTSGSDRGVSFVLPTGVAVYGGYAGLGAGDPNSRDVSGSPTVLSGDIGAAGIASDNSYHVVITSGTDAAAILDGLTIAGGKADTSAASAPPGASVGGGVFNVAGSVTIRNCTFSGNSALSGGGGMYNYFWGAPSLVDCTFNGNSQLQVGGSASSSNGGGALYNSTCSITLNGVAFVGNSSTSTLGGGGAIYNYACSPDIDHANFVRNSAVKNGGAIYNATFSRFSASSPQVLNSIFNGNSAGGAGGAAYTEAYCRPTFTNCIFSGNSAAAVGGAIAGADQSYLTLNNCTLAGNAAVTAGGALYTYYSTVISLNNSIFWGNAASGSSQIFFGGGGGGASYCDVQGGFSGFHPLNADPLFVRNPSPGADGTWDGVNDDYGDLRLQFNSPCVDVGGDAYVPAGVTTDLLAQSRFIDFPGTVGPGGIVDLGAYELGSTLGLLRVGDGQALALPSGGHVFTVEQLVLGVNSRLDVGDDTLLITYSGASPLGSWNGAAYTGITGLVASGRNGGNWDGVGIITSQTSATGGNTVTTLAVAEASDALGISGSQTALWNGQTVDGTTVIVKYTYSGDANLDGTINGDDYFQIDSGFPQQRHGWLNGDFNYDGAVSGDDYFLIDSTFPAQGLPL